MEKRAKYFNIGYITNQTLTDKVDAEAEWKSDFGVSLAFGKRITCIRSRC